MASMDELQVLSLSGNRLTGSIPELRNLTKLVSLDLSDDQLPGDIPDMEALPSLRNLNLGGNLLTGFSESGFRSTSLTIVDISRNTLRGPIPSRLGNVPYLDLSNNMLSGNIPQDIRNVSLNMDYSHVDLSANQLNGSIPQSLIRPGFFYLNLAGNFLVGNIPEGRENINAYRYVLDVSDNMLDGPFPFSSISNSFLYLRLGGNRISGDMIDHLITVLTTHNWATPIWLELRLGGNQFTGNIATLLPALNGNSTYDNTLFGALDLSYNSFTMTVQTAEDPNPLQAMLEDPHLHDLTELRLAGNSLMGISLPETLNRTLPSLHYLDLSDTFLEGEIREELLTRLGNLTHFSVSMNRLSGGIPAKLPGSLQVLEIGVNHLEGEIPDGIFTGLPSLLVFNASNNRLGGRIPSMPPGLQVLDLSGNNFSGELPPSMPPGLQVLDLSGNNFSGELPSDLFLRLPNLTFFNLSSNRLSGPIPAGLPLNVSTSAFANNPGLCGRPLPDCPPEPDRGGIRVWVLVTVVVAAVLVTTGASCLLLAWKWRRYAKKHEQDAELIATLLDRDTAVTLMPLRDLRRATNNFSEGSQIGAGGFGTVYVGKLANGTTVAIKRSRREGSAQDKQQFLNEVKILSQVHHRHLVKLLGCSMVGNKAALVFEYVPNGTLQEHIRGKREGWLSWRQRLLIAVQTSDALAYLHSAAKPPIFHRDVKSSNILLDEDFNTKVADFGISKLAPMGASHVSTLGIAGTMGYIDPEYFSTYQLTAKSDVYSFGVVLLELISAKSPVDYLRDSEEASLVDLAFSVMDDGDWERLIDPRLLETFITPTGKESIHSTCALAAKCLARRSRERPDMREVWKQLQTFWVQYEASLDHVKNLPSDIKVLEIEQDYSSSSCSL